MRTFEIAELREAYGTETTAVQRIADLKRRLARSEAVVVLRGRERDGMARRAGAGELITPAELRKAAEAVSDAEAMVTMLRDALPVAARTAQEASRARQSIELDTVREAYQPFHAALADADAALKSAQTTRDRAHADYEKLPARAQTELDALLDGHGRNVAAARAVDEMVRVEAANRGRKAFGQPLLAWP